MRDLINSQSGGEFRTFESNCDKVNLFLKLFSSLLLNNQNSKINELYNTYEILFVDIRQKDIKFNDKLNTILLASINFLIGIKLSNITNMIVRSNIKIVYDTYFYNDSPTGPTFTDNKLDLNCLNNMKVWNTQFFLEDFWRCTIDEFMDEYDKFELTQKSYLFYWINLINVTMLLCKLKSCSYYFIRFDENDVLPTFDTYDQYIVGDDKSERYSNCYYLNEKEKFVLITINDITHENIKNLTQTLIKSFSCEYSNILLFYTKLLCFLLERENRSYSAFNLLGDIKKLCTNTNSFDGFFYLSLNLPKDAIFARNEYTKFYATTINPVRLIDNLPLSIVQIVGHDLTFHNMKTRKVHDVGIVDTKTDFRELIDIIKTHNQDKSKIIYPEHFYINDLNFYKSNYFEIIQKLINKHSENYDPMNIVHFLFHEIGSVEPFTRKSLAESINRIIDGNFTGNALMNDYELALEVVYFIQFLHRKHFILTGNDTDKMMGLQIVLILNNIMIKNFEEKGCDKEIIEYFSGYSKRITNFAINNIKYANDWRFR